MITGISILLPTYNDICTDAVSELARQAEDIEGLRWELIVADDGSTDPTIVAANNAINEIDHCRLICRKENVGRARIRNFLASEARFEWLLFIDSGMGIIRKNFILKYVKAADDGATVVCGGYEVAENAQELRGNLRFLYENAAEKTLSVQWRREHAYENFHTSNFIISKEVYLANPLDERFRRYGYEDVLLGKQLKKNHVFIEHIDNPVAFSRFESNQKFVQKTEESLLTLQEFAHELQGYSKILDAETQLHKWHLARPYVYIYNRCRERWRSNLCGEHPSLHLFKAYKIGYFLSLQA